jgi:TPR repeat protein
MDLEKTAKNGSIDACFELSNFYLMVDYQPERATQWMETAAKLGSPEAKRNVEELRSTPD